VDAASSPIPAGAPLVAILSHDAHDARLFQTLLAAAIDGIQGADPQALNWTTGSQAQAARGCALCLLLAWDSSGAAAPDIADLQAHRELRQDLQAIGQTFAVLRGKRDQQLQQALAALSRLQGALKPPGAQTLPRPGWQAMCDKCDEPECEHTLLVDLLKTRQAPKPESSSPYCSSLEGGG